MYVSAARGAAGCWTTGSSGSRDSGRCRPIVRSHHRGCRAPLLRRPHHDSRIQPRSLKRSEDRCVCVARIHLPCKSIAAIRNPPAANGDRRELPRAAELRFSPQREASRSTTATQSPPAPRRNMSFTGKDTNSGHYANYVGPYRLEKTLGKGQTG